MSQISDIVVKGRIRVNWTKLASRIVKRFRPRFGLRSSDVLLASFPKSGNTWLRFIWANMISLLELDERKVDFHFLNQRLVAEYDSHSYGDVQYDALPRLVKTHLQYDADAFGENGMVYLIRHPGDVAVSYFEYRRAQQGKRSSTPNLETFLRDPDHGVPAWCEHVRSWRSRADVILKYEELKEDAAAAVRRMLRLLGLDEIDPRVVGEAVRRSSFDTLREIERNETDMLPDRFDPDYRFMRRGTTGEWRERLGEAESDYLRETVRRFGLGDMYRI